MSTRRYPAPNQTSDYQRLTHSEWEDEPIWTSDLYVSSGAYFVSDTRIYAYYGVYSYLNNYFSSDTGIGVYSPTYRLSVYDYLSSGGYVASFRNNYNATTADCIALRLRADTPATTGHYLSCFDGATTETGGGFSGGIAGDAAGGIQINYSSDRRLKTDIRPAQARDELTMVKALPLVRFKRNGKDQLGFVAQDLYAVCPDAAVDPTERNEATFVLIEEVEEEERDERGQKKGVKKVERRKVVEPGTKGGRRVEWGDPEYMPWMISPMKLIPPLVGAVQALAEQVEEQAGTIADLLRRVESLERQRATGPSSDR